MFFKEAYNTEPKVSIISEMHGPPENGIAILFGMIKG